MVALTRRIVLAGMVSMAWAPALHAADPGIETVIGSQLEAFKADDAEGAYARAAPNIRRMFPTKDVFISMVERGYMAIRRPSQWAFGRSREVSATSTLQEVIVTGPDGKSWRAIYQMEKQPDGSWLIAGVSLKEADLPSI